MTTLIKRSVLRSNHIDMSAVGNATSREVILSLVKHARTTEGSAQGSVLAIAHLFILSMVMI